MKYNFKIFLNYKEKIYGRDIFSGVVTGNVSIILWTDTHLCSSKNKQTSKQTNTQFNGSQRKKNIRHESTRELLRMRRGISGGGGAIKAEQRSVNTLEMHCIHAWKYHKEACYYVWIRDANENILKMQKVDLGKRLMNWSYSEYIGAGITAQWACWRQRLLHTPESQQKGFRVPITKKWKCPRIQPHVTWFKQCSVDMCQTPHNTPLACTTFMSLCIR